MTFVAASNVGFPAVGAGGAACVGQVHKGLLLQNQDLGFNGLVAQRGQACWH